MTQHPAPSASNSGRRLVVALVLLVLGLFGFSAAPASAGEDLTQCANGPLASPTDCVFEFGADGNDSPWINGLLGDNKAHYFEGDTVPYRLILTDIPSGTQTLTIEWDTTKGGKRALDFITNFNRTEKTADPCANNVNPPVCTGAPDKFLIPEDPDVDDAFENLPNGDPAGWAREFAAWGGDITAMSGYTLVGSYAADSSRSITISFTDPDGDGKVVFAWGGHISTRADWGAGNSAIAISGAPYHMRLDALSFEGVGQQDAQLASSAVIFPASITVNKDVDPEPDATDFNFTASGTGIDVGSTSFSLDDDANGTLSNTKVINDTAVSPFKPGKIVEFGTKVIDETSANTGGYTLSALSACTTDVVGKTAPTISTTTGEASIPLEEGENVVCNYKNVRDTGKIEIVKNLEPSGDSGRFNLELDGSSTMPDASVATNKGDGGTTGEQTVGTGSHNVDESGFGGTLLSSYQQSISCIDQAAANAPVTATADPTNGGWNVNVTTGSDIQCTITNERHATITFVKNVVSATDASQTFAFTGPAWVNSSPYGNNQGETESITSFPASDQTVSETRIAGWSESVSCSGDTSGDTSVDNANGSTVSATFRPDPGENITCTFVNREDATIQFVKDVVSSSDPNHTFAFSGPAWVNSSPYGDNQGETETITSWPAGEAAQTVSETRIAGWSESVSCTGDNSGDTSVDNADGATVSATFRPDPGEDIVCTFVNTDDATIQFVKEVVSATDPNKTFVFTGGAWVDSSPYGNNQGETQTISSWPSGEADQTVSETRINGWSETVSCVGDAGDTTVDNNDATTVSATFRPDPGDNIVCTFVNTEASSIRFVKEVVSATNPNQTFAFSGPAWVNSSPYGDNEGETETITSFPAADQTVSETRIAGWSESVACTGDNSGDTSVDNADASTVSATFRPDPGEDIVCTFTNTEDATIQFVKQVESATDPNKTFAFSGGAWVDSSPYGDNQGETQTISTWPAGEAAQAVSETRIAGWSESVSCTGDNSGDTSVDNADASTVTATFRPDPGEDIVCTFLNVDDATIEFVKEVESATDPNKTFVFTGGAWVDSSPYGDGQGETQTISDWPAGEAAQAVSETRIAGWSESVSCTGDNSGDTSVDNADTSTVTATFRPDPGENIVCTFLNTEESTIRFVKDVISVTNPNQTFAFTGPAWVNSSPYGDNQGETETIGSFPAADQTVSETRQAGWSESVACTGDDSGDTSVDNGDANTVSATFRPDPGEDIVCTFTNTEDAKLITKKVVVSSSHPNQEFSFSGTAIDGAPQLLGNNETREKTITSFAGDPEFTAIEAKDANWTTTLACTGDNLGTRTSGTAQDATTATATFRPEPGETVTCTFTNTELGKVVIKKVTNDGLGPDFPFTSSGLTGNSDLDPSTFSLGHNDTKTVNQVVPNDGANDAAYTVSETFEKNGYRLAGVTCGPDLDSSGSVQTRTASIKVSPGETVTCTFTNDKVIGSAIVVKAGTELAHHGNTLEFTFTVTNSGNSPLHDVAIEDNRCAPLVLDAAASTGEEDDILDLADVWIYTCSYVLGNHPVDGEVNASITNTVDVSAFDEHDRPVGDSDTHDTDILHPGIAVDKQVRRGGTTDWSQGGVLIHVGETLEYQFLVTNTGDTPLLVSTPNDPRCDAGTLSGPVKGGTNGTDPDRLETGEVWTWTCSHVVTESDPDPLPNTVTVTGTDQLGENEDPLGVVTADDSANADVVHPKIAIEKSGPATAQAGDRLGYTLVVTNPGDVAIVGETVAVTDPLCDSPPVLDNKGGDSSPNTLDPGDSWTYKCSAPTAAGQTSVLNVANVQGTDIAGGVVKASDDLTTTLTQPKIEVKPAVVVSGASRLSGPSACVTRKFRVRVTGRQIAKVVISIDGRKVKTFRSNGTRKTFSYRVNPGKYGSGLHRLRARVTYVAAAATPARTLNMTFERCAKQAVKPLFTG